MVALEGKSLMRKASFILATALGLLGPVGCFAQSSGDWLPQSGVKSPYSPLAVPTMLKPLPMSLTELLNKGFKVISTTDYSGQGVLLTIEGRKQTVLCVLTAPNPQTDQNVPTSRCWALN
ncbi:hypothetical protein HC62_17880 [Acetobacter tropicalis]|nr:hypothetical protein WG31_11015 [Acetobacter oryzifermentans]OUI80308.1 hypothetical protein HC62_17880 [Acetobacter tropicalis]